MSRFITFTIVLIVTAMGCVQSLHANSTAPAASKPVENYVFVENGVQKPGRYHWYAGMTVVDAIDAAGGFSDAAGRKIKIQRIDGGVNRAYLVDRDKLYISIQPPVLKPYDLISVPEKVL